MKTILSKKNNVVVSFVVFLAVSGLGGPRPKDSNLSEAKCGSLKLRCYTGILGLFCRFTCPEKCLGTACDKTPKQDLGYHIMVIICLDSASRY